MRKTSIFVSIILLISILSAQVGVVFAASPVQEITPIIGTVQRITLETDPNTGITTVIVEITDADQEPQRMRLSQETATGLGLVSVDADGKAVINTMALATIVEIDPSTTLPEQPADQHPLASALATFFSDIAGYDTIMAAHNKGISFGVIAQALWLTSEFGGDEAFFQDLLYAKVNNDYGAFAEFTEDGLAPKNWGQLRKALLYKKNLGGAVVSNSNLGNENQNKKNKDKEKDKDNTGNDNGNGTDNNKNK